MLSDPHTEYYPFLPQGQLYDYWKPLSVDIRKSQEEQEGDSSDDGEETVSQEEKEAESSSTEENDVDSEDEKDERKDAMDDSKETEDKTKSDKPDKQ